MDDDTTIEQDEARTLGNALKAAGLAVAAAALFASGGLAILLSVGAIGCMAGGYLFTTAAAESPCERYLRESAETSAPEATPEPSIGLGQEPGQRWRQSVAASRRTTRQR